MKKVFTILFASALLIKPVKSQIFINNTGSTNNTDPTYRVGKVAIGKNTPAADMLVVNGNIVIPFGNYIGVNNTDIPYKRFIQTGWDATNGDFLSLFTSGTSVANQNEKIRILSIGNVGIGTTDPISRLHVYEPNALGSTVGNTIRLSTFSGNVAGGNILQHNTWLVRSEAGDDWWRAKLHDGISLAGGGYSVPGTDTKTWWERNPFADIQSWGNANTTYMQLNNGKLGIYGGIKTNKYLSIFDNSTPSSMSESFTVYGSGKTEIKIAASTADKVAFSVTDLNTNKINFRVKADGFVHAREVEILNTAITFPDYVFAKDYKLLSLNELESYIHTNKHLPSFENAAYYETNGIKSSEMFVKQQEKIEELTLYIIELEKRLKVIEDLNKH